MARYHKDGLDYPSVTEIIDQTLAKGEGFYRWKYKDEEQAKKKSTKAATRGTKVHNILHKAITDTGYVPVKKRGPLVDRIRSFVESKQVIASERQIYYSPKQELPLSTMRRFAGTPDLILEENGMLSVYDFKTGKPRREHELQLGGYMLLAGSEFKKMVGKTAIIYVSGNHLSEQPIDAKPDLFLKLVDIHQWLHTK